MPAVLTSINNGQYITDLEQVVQFKGSGFGTDMGRCGVFVGSTSYEFTVSAWTDVVIYAIPPSDLPPGAFRLGWVALAGEGEPIAPLFAGEGGVLSMPNDSRNSPAPIIPSGLFSDQVVGGLWEFDAAGTGAPEGVAGRYWLRVVNGVAGDRTYQEAIRQSDGKHFERKDIADAWERVITSTDLTQNAVDDTDGRVLQVGAAGILKGYYREAHSFTYPEYSKGAGFMYVGSGPHTDAPPNMSTRPGFVFEHKREGSDIFMQEYIRSFPQTGDVNGLEHFARVVNTEVGGQTTDWLKYWHSGNLAKTSGAYDDTDGRVLKLGYGGIGAPVDNTTETDCNNMTQGGSVYYHDAGTAANRPTDDPFTIEVQAFGPWPGPYGYTQRYTNLATGMTGRRHLTAGGGSWTAWVNDGGSAAALDATTSSTDTSGLQRAEDLNRFVFPTYNSSNVHVAKCYGESASAVYVDIPTDFKSSRATSLTVASTFKIMSAGAQPTGTPIFSGITSASMSLSNYRSDVVTKIYIDGLTGIIAGLTYDLYTETSTSKITLG